MEFASLADPTGVGVLVAGVGMTVDADLVGDATVLSHVALVPGDRGGEDAKGENVSVSSRIKAGSIKAVAGTFWLLPLGTAWPKPLVKWIGPPGDRVDVNRPFLRSYDR